MFFCVLDAQVDVESKAVAREIKKIPSGKGYHAIIYSS